MKNKRILFSIWIYASIALHAQTAEQPNILFVISDDLNDYVNTLYDSHPQTETPNIAALAGMGTVFQNAFCNSPLCAPSRTSFLTGKLPDYTGVNINGMFNCSDFMANITPSHYIMPLPQYLKDSAGYFTYSLGKIYHCAANEYDQTTSDPCSRGKSWNLLYNLGTDAISNAGQENPQGISEIKWSRIDSSLTPFMDDYMAADSVIAFFNRYDNDPSEFCDRPFFMAYGIKKPHSNLYIPSQYFLDYYVDDFYATPYVIPYNQPYNAYPYNGFVMPPQPAIPYSDIDSLGQLAKDQMPFAAHNQMNSWYNDLSPLPEIDPSLTDTERQNILIESKRANGTMAYMAAVKFVDEQFGRVMSALAEHPDLYNNTIVIFVSDHGFAWGEKKHYGKAQLYETDIRVPLIIADLRNPVANVTQRTVSLIDLYPTICEYAGVSLPVFADGTPYLDGKSLIPLTQNPNLQIETPAIIQIRNSVDGMACFPQSSVRNENYHYIRFISNGGPGATACDSANTYTEK
ncbi:MAG: sulfatase-like hydrolase/transferase, partial [Chitinophagales bacterium]